MFLISLWLRVNKLSANPQKTEFIVIGHQRRVNEIKELPSLKLNDREIKRVGKVKSLGVIVDEGLTWNYQFRSLTGKLAAGLLSLKKLKDVLPQPKLCDGGAYRQLNFKRYSVCKIESCQSSQVQVIRTLGLKIG